MVPGGRLTVHPFIYALDRASVVLEAGALLRILGSQGLMEEGVVGRPGGCVCTPIDSRVVGKLVEFLVELTTSAGSPRRRRDAWQCEGRLAVFFESEAVTEANAADVVKTKDEMRVWPVR